MKIKRVLEDLKILKSLKKRKNTRMIIKIVKIYLGLSLVVLWAVWGLLSFDSSLVRLIFLKIYRPPSYVVSTNYRVLIYCICHFKGSSLCFSFCLLVSSVSNFCPDTRGRWWTLFKAHFFSRAVGREGCCKQVTLACACTCPSSRCVCFPCLHCLGSRFLCWGLSEASPGLCK